MAMKTTSIFVFVALSELLSVEFLKKLTSYRPFE
jgi:hypothetical protein